MFRIRNPRLHMVGIRNRPAAKMYPDKPKHDPDGLRARLESWTEESQEAGTSIRTPSFSQHAGRAGCALMRKPRPRVANSAHNITEVAKMNRPSFNPSPAPTKKQKKHATAPTPQPASDPTRPANARRGPDGRHERACSCGIEPSPKKKELETPPLVRARQCARRPSSSNQRRRIVPARLHVLRSRF